jgi:hypothetical protein
LLCSENEGDRQTNTEDNLRLDLQGDWRALVIASLTNEGLQADLRKGTEDLHLQLLHYQRRCVEPRKRGVREAKELACPAELKNGYEAFKTKVMAGEDLRPYLSTGIERLRSRDHLLNDWGIHHFHLGLTPKANQPEFMERTGDVLFAMVRPETIYAIGFWHHEFEDAAVLKIIQKNWPRILETARCKNVVGMENPNKTPDEIRQLRQAGIMTLQQVGGSVFFSPGGGFSSTGDNAQDVGLVNQTLLALKRLPKLIEQWVAESGLPCPTHIRMEEFNLHRASFRELNSGKTFALANF